MKYKFVIDYIQREWYNNVTGYRRMKIDKGTIVNVVEVKCDDFPFLNDTRHSTGDDAHYRQYVVFELDKKNIKIPVESFIFCTREYKNNSKTK